MVLKEFPQVSLLVQAFKNGISLENLVISKGAAVILGFASQGKVSLEPSALKSHLTELEGGQNGFCPNAFERSENLKIIPWAQSRTY